MLLSLALDGVRLFCALRLVAGATAVQGTLCPIQNVSPNEPDWSEIQVERCWGDPSSLWAAELHFPRTFAASPLQTTGTALLSLLQLSFRSVTKHITSTHHVTYTRTHVKVSQSRDQVAIFFLLGDTKTPGWTFEYSWVKSSWKLPMVKCQLSAWLQWGKCTWLTLQHDVYLHILFGDRHRMCRQPRLVFSPLPIFSVQNWLRLSYCWKCYQRKNHSIKDDQHSLCRSILTFI